MKKKQSEKLSIESHIHKSFLRPKTLKLLFFRTILFRDEKKKAGFQGHVHYVLSVPESISVPIQRPRKGCYNRSEITAHKMPNKNAFFVGKRFLVAATFRFISSDSTTYYNSHVNDILLDPVSPEIIPFILRYDDINILVMSVSIPYGLKDGWR